MSAAKGNYLHHECDFHSNFRFEQQQRIWNFHQKDGNPKWGVSMGGPKQNGTFDHPEHQKD